MLGLPVQQNSTSYWERGSLLWVFVSGKREGELADNTATAAEDPKFHFPLCLEDHGSQGTIVIGKYRKVPGTSMESHSFMHSKNLKELFN